MDVGLLVMEAGDTFTFEEAEKEIAILLFAGTVTYQWAGKTVEAERPDCFHHGLDLPLHAAQKLAIAPGVLGLDGVGGVHDRLKGLFVMTYFNKNAELKQGYNPYIDMSADDMGTQMDVGLLVMALRTDWRKLQLFFRASSTTGSRMSFRCTWPTRSTYFFSMVRGSSPAKVK